MELNDFYSNLFNGKPIELNSNCYSGVSNCTFLVDGLSFSISGNSQAPITFDRKKATIDLTFNSDTFQVDIVVSVTKSELFKFEGDVKKMEMSSNKSVSVDRVAYVIAGVDSFPMRNNFTWDRSYKIDGIEHEVSYAFVNCRIEARISTRLMLGSKECDALLQFIEDEVFVTCLFYSLCRSTKVEWVEKKIIHSNSVCSYHYLSSNAPSKYSNQINPMRSDTQTWEDFMRHVISKSYKKKDLIDSQIFQAISNLAWNGKLNEWTLISHAAALEGLCKHKTVSVIKDNTYKKARNTAISCLTSELSKLGVDSDSIARIKQNIYDNERSINGYPTKWYIENELISNNLSQFSAQNLDNINLAIQMRNKVVHEGWSSDWKLDIYDCVAILRNTIYVLLFAYSGYDGNFYLVGSEEKTVVAKYA
ncbi:TPA: hypothetical protein ACPJ0P_004772 [Vibrio alginolyticus]|uniref:hypothetical protein n=1 Tax=Vibrio TaxID=662 RepID=UPI0021D3A2F4|nr:MULTISPECIES: hypothetical protein [unclassified Vibrio]MDW1827846.1 hypothetical protein [Vibrio sp. Vb0937]MDW3189048.1 hypothetical protein [Vibrio sp. Vb0932]